MQFSFSKFSATSSFRLATIWCKNAALQCCKNAASQCCKNAASQCGLKNYNHFSFFAMQHQQIQSIGWTSLKPVKFKLKDVLCSLRCTWQSDPSSTPYTMEFFCRRRWRLILALEVRLCYVYLRKIQYAAHAYAATFHLCMTRYWADPVVPTKELHG